MKQLDFIIIGAQKSATTSVHRYLQRHPDVVVPQEKEVPFFSWDSMYEAGWSEFSRRHFARADREQLWGTATPQYMMDPLVPARIRQAVPEVRLIALLRDPIERAYSHYTMMRRRGYETREFSAAIEALLQPEALDRARRERPPGADGLASSPEAYSEAAYYVAWGEYGRILSQFLVHFPPHQLLIQFAEAYRTAPGESFATLLSFIGADANTLPDNLGEVYHKGQTRTLVPSAWRQSLRRQPWFRAGWDRLPQGMRARIGYWYDQLNEGQRRAHRSAKTEQNGLAPIDAYTRARLIDHYRTDITTLETVTGCPVPWGTLRRGAE